MKKSSLIKTNLKDKGALWWKRRWISVCSMHQKSQWSCSICQTGHWSNVWAMALSRAVFFVAPKFWIAWVNYKK